MSKKKKKIIYIILNGKSYGGSEKHVADLINLISNTEYEKYLIYSKGNKIIENIISKNVINCIGIERDFLSIKEIIKVIKSINPEIIHIHAARAIFMGRVAALICRNILKMKFKVIATSHGLWLPDNKNNFIYKFLMHFMKKIDDITIAVSIKSRNELIEKGYNPKKLIAIYNGVNFKDFDEFREIKKNINKVGFIGRFTDQKGIKILLPAIQKCNENYDFVIYGEGELKDYIENYINSNKLKNVKQCGYSNNVGQVFKEIDLLLAPSIDEGLPYILVEAINCGVPVIATNVGGIPEIIYHKKNGLIISKNSIDDLVYSLNEIKELDIPKLSEQSIIISKKFSIDEMIERVEKAYSDLLNSKGTLYE